MADAVEVDRLAEQRPSLIGSRLRASRMARRISLRELADKIGVSPSLISQIERDKVNPSVSTLWALVTELGLTMGEVFDGPAVVREAAPAPHALALGPATTPQTRAVMHLAGGVRWERLTTGTDPLVEFVYVVYEVGSTSCPEDSLVRHGGREYGYITSGELAVRIGFDEYRLGPGGSISFDSSAPHRLWNVGSVPVHGIWVVVGRQNDPRVSLGEPNLTP
jgi:transcriptional regulator with XRE-family HTH domain